MEEYAASSMGALQREYIQPVGEDQPSTYALIQQLARKTKLERSDIQDRGVLWTDAPPRFVVAPSLMERIDRGVGELQTFIQRASNLLPDRRKDLFQLEAAWDILRERLETGQRFFAKYIDEFKDATNVPNSPASTTVAIHQQLASMPRADDRLRVIMHDFRVTLKNLDSDKRSALVHGSSWSRVVNVGPNVSDAFPRRTPERNPILLTYDEEGNQVQMIPPQRSSTKEDSNVTAEKSSIS
ncbi:hypothetical protein R3P38DRAFT_3221902 [Favolaschia claudopus]|uniref:Gag protein n=1 Tax=Favolaschia claudopus TaxID=2862362 RepID=A0AAW0A123_9AGAR